jgi:hypothetical protein
VSHSSDSNDSPDEAIPLLTEVLVTGSPTRSHHVAAPAAPVDTAEDVPVLEDVFEAPTPKAPTPAQAPEAVTAAPAVPVIPAAEPVTLPEAVATPNADALAEHLRGKFTAYLRGPGQEVIEERCRAAMQVHATWLVGQIAKEVGAVLEAQMSNWVREAVEEERRRQS